MSERLKYLSKDKEQRKQQLSLLIHNCSVYNVKNEIKQKYIDELESRKKKKE